MPVMPAEKKARLAVAETKTHSAVRNFLKRLLIGTIITLSALGINILLYFVLTRGFKINYLISNAWAWLGYVVFLYALRKYILFRKTATGFKAKFREFYLFAGLRFATGILDMIMMFVLVSLIGVHAMNAKFVVIAIITVINTIMSNFWVFRPPKAAPAINGAKKPDNAAALPGPEKPADKNISYSQP